MKTFYDVLNVKEDATLEEITTAYKNLKSKYELELLLPEKKEQIQKILKNVEVAYKVLGNAENKAKYDNDLQVMRNNELMSKLQQNTNEYNKEIQKKEELELLERKQKEAEERLIVEQEEKRKAEEIKNKRTQIIQEAIQKQIEEHKQQQEIIEKNRKKIQKQIERNSFKNRFIRTIIAVLVVLLVVFLIFQIPFVKNWFNVRLEVIKNLFN